LPVELTRRSFLLGAGVLIPILCSSPNNSQEIAGAQTADQCLSVIETRLGGRLGVAAWDTQKGKRIEHRAGERFPMCSTFKFLLVSAILSRVDANQEKLDRFIDYTKADLLDYAPITKAHVQDGGMTISALSAAAIEYSDHTAANLLLGVLGGPAALTRYARSLGDSVTRLDRNEPTLNAATPGDLRDTTSPSAMMTNMKEILIEQRTLSSESRKHLEAWMIADTTGLTSLRAGLPSAWRVGNKTVSGKNGATNDIAICWPSNRTPVLITAYFVGSSASYADRYAALAEVGRIAADECS
jgi:beta-lactamase class A